MEKKNHVHKLKRHRHSTGSVVYFCVEDDCTVKIKPALALGKKTICWRCGQEFRMNEYSIRLAKPHCTDCHKPKYDKGEVIAESLLRHIHGFDKPTISQDSVSDLRSRLDTVSRELEEEKDI